MNRRRRGFTLIELSIVLVILGLLTGGIVVATTLIRNSKLQRVVADVSTYTKAMQLFRDKYKALPGDMPDAASFWGTDSGCSATTANSTPKTATCNGNGDGVIGDSTGTPGATATNWYEPLRAWQHLANASLIIGSYTGAQSSRTTNNTSDPGMNVPKGDNDTAGFSISYAAPNAGDTSYFTSSYGHILVYGSADVTASGKTFTMYKEAITTGEAMMIDQKMDDGMPGTGKVLTFATTLLPNCATSNSPSTATYNSAVTANACSLIFLTGL